MCLLFPGGFLAQSLSHSLSHSNPHPLTHTHTYPHSLTHSPTPLRSAAAKKDRSQVVPKLREDARIEYVKERKDKQLRMLEAEVLDEEFLFGDQITDVSTECVCTLVCVFLFVCECVRASVCIFM